ncbi:MAG: hypothetical protein ISS70_24560, partial [Phycisphaerae bacterium]|nr:hypothetical protein [Phycisphaerae bacterium]
LANDSTPELTGTVDDPDAVIEVTVDGTAYGVVNNGDGTWTLADDTISPALTDGVYDIEVAATDLAGNVSSDATTDELTVDTTLPVVTVDTLLTNDSTPQLTGTVDDNDAIIEVTVAGNVYAAVNNGGGTWTLADDTISPALADGTYDVSVSATDLAGNVGPDATTDELTVNTAAPTVTVDSLLANDSTPELTGTVNDPDAVIEVTVAGNTYSAVNNGDGTWTLADDTISLALVDGTYDVSASATDLAGNTGADTTADELTVDTTPPVVTVDTLLANDSTPELTGTVDDPDAVIEVTVDGNAYSAINNGDGTWTLADDTISPALADGTYDMAVSATDLVGNAGSDSTTDELTIDTEGPTLVEWSVSEDSGANPTDGLTNDTTPELTFTFSEIAFGEESDVIVVDPDSNPVTPDSVSGWGSDTLVVTFSTPLVLDGEYTVTLNGTGTIEDEAGNPLNGGVDEVVNFTLDTTAPVVTVDTLLTNDATPELTGTVDDPDAVIEVAVDGTAYGVVNNGDGTWTLADDTIAPALADGTYDVQASATDLAGNTGADGTSNELTITSVPTPDPNVDTDGDGILSGEEFGPDGSNQNFDGNGDGVPDWMQGNVASWHTVTGDYVTLACNEAYALSNVRSVDNPSSDDMPSGVEAPYGFFEFTILGMPVGGSVMVELFVPDGSIINSYYKYGLTPGNPTDHWYEFTFDGQTGAVIDGNVISLHFVDGLRGDDDITVNGVVVEPGAPVSAAEPFTASIGDFVWHDLYHGPSHLVDGIQDADEPGIKGVVIDLLDGTGTVIASTTTDGIGAYQFAGLKAGSYIIEVSPENFLCGGVLYGWYGTFKNQGSDETKDSDGDRRAHRSDIINLGIGEDRTDIDFGFFTAIIELTKTGPNTVQAGETITYHFRVQNLGDVVQHGGAQVYDPMLNPKGNHKIWSGVLQPGQAVEFDRAYTTTADDAGELVNTAWAVGHPLCPDGKYVKKVSDNADWTVTVIPTVTPSNGSIGDFIWHDLYHGSGHLVDGIQDAGEPGIEGVAVNLLDITGNRIASAITDKVGLYQFTGLDAGTYVVEVSPENFLPGGVLKGWYATLQDRGGNETADSDGNPPTYRSDPVILTTGEQNADVDFGFFTAVIDLTKTGPDTAKAGETITYHFRVKNLGDVVQHGGAQVYDPMINPSKDHKIWDGILQPGQIVEFDRVYTITADDVGELVNTAWAIGHPLCPDGKYVKNVIDNDNWTVTVSPPDPSTDSDGDGILSGEEFGPAGTDQNFDGNADSLSDWTQDNVASWHTVTGDYVTIVCGEAYALSNVNSLDNPSPDNIPLGVDAPYGFFEFMIVEMPVGGSVTVELLVPDGSIVDSYYKYGGTLDNPLPHWYQFDFDGTTGAVIDGDVIRLYFVDGRRGDDDLTANGTIIDPGVLVRTDNIPSPPGTSDLVLAHETISGHYGPADDVGAAAIVSAGSISYLSTDNNNGSWTSIDSTISPAFSNGMYNVPVYTTDPLRNGSTGVAMGELDMDFYVPMVVHSVLPENTRFISTDKLPENDAPELSFVFSDAVLGNSGQAETLDPASAVLIPNDISANGLSSDTPAVTLSKPLVRDAENAVTAEAAGSIKDAAINKLNAGIQDEGRHLRLYKIATLIVGLTVLSAMLIKRRVSLGAVKTRRMPSS